MTLFGPPIRRLRTGTYRLDLSPEERNVLRAVPEVMQSLLAEHDAADPALRRLFPPAYIDDAEGEAEYRRLMGDDLAQGRQAALETMAATIDATELDEGQMNAWLSALNSLRLVLGTQLDVQEDVDLPDTPAHNLYQYLTNVEGMVVDAMASQFD